MSSATPTKSPIHILHAHTTMSILDGASTVKEYVKHAKDTGLNFCSCTDHGYVMGVHDLIKECKANGIKPAPGLEAYLDVPPWYVCREGLKPVEYFHLTLWAINQKGHKNLMKLSTLSWTAGRVIQKFGNYKARLSWGDLSMYNEGIVIGTGCIEGPIGKPLIRGETQMAVENASVLMSIFGDRMFFEIMPSPVINNFRKAELLEVTGECGEKLVFLPTDILETDQGTMTAHEAMQNPLVTEINSSIPDRFQIAPLAGSKNQPERSMEVDFYLPDDNINSELHDPGERGEREIG